MFVFFVGDSDWNETRLFVGRNRDSQNPCFSKSGKKEKSKLGKTGKQEFLYKQTFFKDFFCKKKKIEWNLNVNSPL